MIYLYLFGTCFHFIYVFMIIENNKLLIGYFCVILGVCQLRNGGFGK